MEIRLGKLEQELKELRSTAAGKETAAMGFFVLAALAAFVFLMAKFPFPGDPEGGARFMRAIGSAIGGGGVMACALAFAKFALRAFVEFLVVALALVNGLYPALVSVFFENLKEMAVQLSVSRDNSSFIAFVACALALFLFDLVVISSLYPLAKSVGSNALD
jgi:hypothetical protein